MSNCSLTANGNVAKSADVTTPAQSEDHWPDEEIATGSLDADTDDARDSYTVQSVRLSDIRRLPELQVRRKMDPATIRRYMTILDNLPAVDVFELQDEGLVLADGFHRCEAAKKLGREDISARVHAGTFGDVYVFAVEANAKTGLPLSIDDRNDAIIELHRLYHKDHGWQSGWSQRRVSQLAAISEDAVGHVLKAAAVAERVGATVDKSKPGQYVIESAPRGLADGIGNEPGAIVKGLSLGHLSEISRAPEGLQPDIALAAQSQGWTRDETRRKVAKIKNTEVTPETIADLLAGENHQLATTCDSAPSTPEAEAPGAQPCPGKELLSNLRTIERWGFGSALNGLDQDTLKGLWEVLPDCISRLVRLKDEVKKAIDAPTAPLVTDPE